MEGVYKMPNRSAITEEAVAWLIKLDGDEPPASEDLEALTEWLSRSPMHRKELNTVNAFWSNNVLTELMVPLGKPEAYSKSGLLARLRGPNRLLMAAVAAMLCFAIALVLKLIPTPLSEANGLHVTAVGQQKTIALADGSHVQLNTNSQIEVSYSEQYRNIRLLQGEVHFDVAKNPQRPFRVYAGGGRVEAVGTAFTVYYVKNKDVNVLVTEGSVALASLAQRPSWSPPVKTTISDRTLPDEPEDVDPYLKSPPRNLGILKAGQSVTLEVAENSQNGEKAPVKAVEIEEDELSRRLSWREGVLMFSGDPLEQVVNEIGRYTTISIEIADPALREIQIGGRFKVGEIDDVFNALETNFGLQVTYLGYNRVRLSAAPQ